MSNMAVIVDSTCNLPPSVLQKYKISRVPLSYIVDGHLAADPCDDEAILALFKSGKFNRKFEVTTKPPAPEDFARCIIKRIKEGHNSIVVQTVNRVQGDPSSQLWERHDASDFDTKTQDKLEAGG